MIAQSETGLGVLGPCRTTDSTGQPQHCADKTALTIVEFQKDTPLYFYFVSRSIAIFREPRKGVRPISGAKNQATAMAFGGHVRPASVPARTPRGARAPART